MKTTQAALDEAPLQLGNPALLVSTLDAIDPLQRIRLTGQLSAALAELKAAANPLARVQAAGKVSAIVKQLVPSGGLRFSLDDKATSSAALSSYLDGGLGQIDPALRPFEAKSVIELAGELGDEAVANQARRAGSIGNITVEEAHLKAFEVIAGRGVPVDIDREAVQRKIVESNEILNASAADDPTIAGINRVIIDRNERYTQESIELNARIRDEPRGSAQRAALQDQFADLVRQYQADYAELANKAKARHAEFHAEKVEKANALFQQEGERVIGAVLAASPVEPEAAQAWAAEQVIDPNAAAKLGKLGYSVADVRRDLAEFYRLSGGKVSAIRLSINGSRRSNAVGIGSRRDEKVINIGSHFTKTVLFHELAHHLENDPIARAASNGFLLKRREGDTVYSLRSLTGQKGYGADEGAYKDSFMDPYIGKVYRDGVTEVFSMGVQYLADPRNAALFAAKDPEMFAMVSGYLSKTLTPAMQAKLSMHAGAVDELQAQRQDQAEQYDAAIAALAAKVAITPDDWWATYRTDNAYEADYLARYQFTKGKEPDYLGSSGDYHVFAGLFRNPNTKRNGKGHLVVQAGSRAYPNARAIPGELDRAKAFIAITEATGLSLDGVWMGYFMESRMRDPKASVIAAAKEAQQ